MTTPRIPRRSLRFSLLAFGLLLSLQAAAESTTIESAADDAADKRPDAKTLDAVQVRGEAEGYTVERTSAGTKTNTPLNEVPQAISVITATQIRDQNAQNLQEVLRYSAGVRTDQYGLDNRGDWFALRGGSSGTTLLDGMRLPLTGYYGVIREEPYAFERIEVMHGPSSVMAGQTAPGGVVNLVHKRPQAEASHEIAVQVGSDERRQIAADLTGPANADGTLLYRLVALARDNETQVEYADDHRRYIAPSLTWIPNDANTLTVYLEYQKDLNRNTNGFFPIVGTLYPSRSGRIPVDRFVGEPSWDRNGGERIRFGYAFEHRFNENWSLRHDLRHDRLTGGFRTIYADFFSTANPGGVYLDEEQRLLSRLTYGSDDHSRITNSDLLLEGRLGSGRVRHTLLVGVDAMAFNADQRISPDAYCPEPFDVYAPVYGTCPEPQFTAENVWTHTRTRQVGMIVQDQIKLDERWVFVGGLRRDWLETNDSSEQAWTKNLGVVYLAKGGWSPYFNYAESFQPVAGQPHGGGTFDPSRGKQAEAGVKWTPDGYHFTATAAVYKLEEKGRLVSDPFNPGYSVQAGPIDAKGIELEANGSIGNWDLIASYTHTKATREDGTRYESYPENSAALWAVHRFAALPGLRIGGGVRYVGKTWDGADGPYVTPSNTLFDAMASYDVGAWRFSLNAVNLTDKTYLATCLSRGDCWYGTKRRVMAEVAYRW
ncbi:TonB-dependent siderophore receptor [Luteimonas panaciterrae]|uniref:TonB-dependent siderophore receptor n=1 Tax=Luteimonas panaciterrae TaxID=363885 RepID=UPI001CF9E1C8|nr:TonB-dependent siderophore receptor [Luteimonas panaciterrae]